MQCFRVQENGAIFAWELLLLQKRKPSFKTATLGTHWTVRFLAHLFRIAEESNSCSDRTRLAACSKAVDCSDPMHDEAK
jgi:hypothetical protein